MKTKFSLFLTLFLLPIVSFGLIYVFTQKKPSTVRAFGVLEVDFGTPEGEPVFEINNMLPGDCVTKSIEVTNSGDTPAPIATRSTNEIDPDLLSEVLSLTISENSTPLYQKTLKEFFVDSDSPNGVSLSTLPVSTTTHYEFNICFQSEAGNEYQNTSTLFDLTFGQILPDIILPEECSHLTGIITKKITGTAGRDRIRGTHLPELIEGLGENDRLDGGGGDDCIIGGDGKDRIDGGQGNDTIVGGNGEDQLDGEAGHDLLFGNSGNDKIDGGSGQDTLYGGSEDDKLEGGSGDDKVYGEDGNDTLGGDAGADELKGGRGNDKIYGDSGDDSLDGQSDTDYLKGNSGVDSCLNGETVHSSCEST